MPVDLSVLMTCHLPSIQPLNTHTCPFPQMPEQSRQQQLFPPNLMRPPSTKIKTCLLFVLKGNPMFHQSLHL